MFIVKLKNGKTWEVPAAGMRLDDFLKLLKDLNIKFESVEVRA